MGERDLEVIEISPPSSEKKPRRKIIQESQDFYFLVSSFCSAEEDETPMKPMLCLNSKSSLDIKSIKEVEDCFILDFDPFESIDLTKLSLNINPSDAFAASDGTSDLCVIAEKGQVACRDYPHSRHLCVDLPFETTPHENYLFLLRLRFRSPLQVLDGSRASTLQCFRACWRLDIPKEVEETDIS
ncbi:hypothetical protein F2P56_035279 [Juglans regia]|uniref:Uncharacterized protein LOC109007526 isoform X2 n=2 Tax=Juglans regia TaxID=51240 RepID=A0A2I4GFT9_JUGRE|nr:uncharacterized protein LOC109007526 isoform X2 [Juglans regia]KAF5442640.1 hypothetical protein F2P56_035279 [Juglans regia]